MSDFAVSQFLNRAIRIIAKSATGRCCRSSYHLKLDQAEFPNPILCGPSFRIFATAAITIEEAKLHKSRLH
jgi:hypothetical protein